VITGATEIAHITTKQDMSRWTRAHADAPGINWSVFAGPGGTMIIVEHAEDRCSSRRLAVAPDVTAVPVPSPVEGTEAVDGGSLADVAGRAGRGRKTA
jgi:hypothetical protein